MPFSWIMEFQHASSTILRVKLKSNISRCLVHWDALRHYINTSFDISKDCEEALPTQTKRWNCDAGQVSKARRTETSLNFEQSLHISTHVYTTIWPRWLRWSALRIYSALAQGFKLTWMVALGRGRVNVSPKSSDESCCCGITISSPSPYLKNKRDVPYSRIEIKYTNVTSHCLALNPKSFPPRQVAEVTGKVWFAQTSPRAEGNGQGIPATLTTTFKFPMSQPRNEQCNALVDKQSSTLRLTKNLMTYRVATSC